ncbi:MAG TPA: response regulator [Bacteroidota bacterium]
MPKTSRQPVPKNILIVEDSPDFASLLKFIVEDDGYEGVIFPLDTANIVEWVRERKPAAVLMDLTLRRKSGMDYIEELKGDHDTKHTPILIITGRDLAQREVVALQLRDISYIRKGRVELDEIRTLIRKVAGYTPPRASGAKARGGASERS